MWSRRSEGGPCRHSSRTCNIDVNVNRRSTSSILFRASASIARTAMATSECRRPYLCPISAGRSLEWGQCACVCEADSEWASDRRRVPPGSVPPQACQRSPKNASDPRRPGISPFVRHTATSHGSRHRRIRYEWLGSRVETPTFTIPGQRKNDK